jgi:asparagine synthase (glutamine-hydrolysing)
MSGIVGIINLDGAPVDRDVLRRMTDFMSFRGPDAQEIWIEGNVGFGHTMLRTTWEAETETQPLTLDGKVWLTADARIDGRAELISELEGELGRPLQIHLRSNGHGSDCRIPNDAELILYAYEAWGEDSVKHLIGDFAFAIWDSRQRRLFCARDHFGVKPFYYAHVGRTFIFSNTLNCVRLHPGVSTTLNEVAIADFLLFGFNQELGQTVFSDISRLPAAHCAIVSNKNFGHAPYWSLRTHEQIRYSRESTYIEHFQELLRVAVMDRVRLNKVGVSMSGGLDSTAVAATANQLSREGRNVDVRAFTIRYEWLIPDDEAYYAGLAAKFLTMPIEYLSVDNYELFERYDEPQFQYPEPYDEPLGTIYWDHIQQIARHARVTLTGQGGDPIFRAPRDFLNEAFRKREIVRFAREARHYLKAFRQLPRLGVRRGLRRRLGKPDGAWMPTYPNWLNGSFERRHDLRHRWEVFTGNAKSLHSVRPDAHRELESRWWPLSFEQYDASWVGNPVEVRHPLFDKRVVEFAMATPPVPWCLNKTLLRQAMSCRLPESVVRRRKRPLQDDPVRVRLCRETSKRLLAIQAPQIERYLSSEAVESITQGQVGKEWATVSGLRPYYLAIWFHQK